MGHKNIGFIGLGNLGLPIALAIAMRGHKVIGYDVNPKRMNLTSHGHMEAGPGGVGNIDDWIQRSKLEYGTLKELVTHSEIIFIAVPTPLPDRYDGSIELKNTEVCDFDYSYLEGIIKKLTKLIKKNVIIAIVSTVLPGTIRNKILPLTNDKMKILHNPCFSAMGIAMKGFLFPSILVIGGNDNDAKNTLLEFYSYTIPKTEIIDCSWEEAELIKCVVNTYSTIRINYANTIMQLCQHIQADCDIVSKAIITTEKKEGPKYLYGGLPDGGGCHPRENMVLAALSNKCKLPYNFFLDAMIARETQIDFLIKLMVRHNKWNLPYAVLGTAFKPETDITAGSAAILFSNTMNSLGYQVHIIDTDGKITIPHIILIGCKKPEYVEYQFPIGSIIIDPFRYIPDRNGIQVVRIGQGRIDPRIHEITITDGLGVWGMEAIQ